MAIVAPFKGLTYNFYKINDIAKVITPPYDIISKEEQEEFYRVHPNNVIRLELGRKKTGDSDWDNRYTRAADYIKRWESEDILTLSRQNSIYLTSHSYDPGNGSGTRIRWGFILLVKIEEEGSGVILPHEKTFSAHKDDRLKLLRACSTQLSQVFGLYEDTGEKILEQLKTFSNAPPDTSFVYKDGTGHKMWQITDQGIFKSVAAAMSDKSIFIADGHHRYETSRNYRNIMRIRYGKSDNKPYEYLMMYLTDMGDEGLTILPSHRLISRLEEFDSGIFVEKAKDWFSMEEVVLSGADNSRRALELKNILEDRGKEANAFVFHCRKDEKYYLMVLKQGVMDKMSNDLQPSLRNLDVIVLSRLVLQKILGFTKEDLDDDSIFRYNSSIESTVSLVDSGEVEMIFLLNPTKIEQVQEIARESLTMPRKSTYFYPKVLTGLVFNKINPNETIQVPL